MSLTGSQISKNGPGKLQIAHFNRKKNLSYIPSGALEPSFFFSNVLYVLESVGSTRETILGFHKLRKCNVLDVHVVFESVFE